MTTTDTMDTQATVEQVAQLAAAGCEIVRVTAPSIRDAENLREIRRQLEDRGVDVPLVAISVAVVLGYFAGIAVGAWGGIGVTEVALTGLYVQIGIPPEQAASGALLHRAIFYAVVIGWGGFSLAREGWSLRDVRADGSQGAR